MRHYSQKIHLWCKEAKVVPVLTIEHIEHALPVAQALDKGGIKLIEITLRTSVALDAIVTIRKALPHLLVAAGTVRNAKDIYAAKNAGAHLAISPGTTRQLLDASFDAMLPIMPGVATPSEAMQWYDYGLNAFKFFPAEYCGGVDALHAMHAPLPDVFFCPTGGIKPTKASQYLALPNVHCIGGSWLATHDHIHNENWDEIATLAQAAMQL